MKETYGDVPGDLPHLEKFYHIDGHTFEKQYKEAKSGFRDWNQLENVEEWLLCSHNIAHDMQ